MSMNRRHFLSAAGAAMLGSLSPSRAADAPADLGTTTGVNPFALDLYAQLRAHKGNVFASPLSVSAALGMTAAGAKGQTLAQMTTALRLPQTADSPEQHRRFAELVQLLYAPQRRVRPFELRVANAIYAQTGYPWRDEYKVVVQSVFQAQLTDVNFAGEAEKVRQEINKWAAEQTADKIQNLFGEGTIDHLTRLVLVNAVYYKGQWEKPFAKAATKDAPFTLADGTKVDAPLMSQKARVKMAETADVQLLELPYAGQQTSMLVFLPTAADGLPKFEQKLTADAAAKLLSDLKPAGEVQVYLPRFKVSTEYALNDTLKAMGVTDAFDDKKADFGGMVTSKPEGPLSITKVVHKAYCEVNEEGTEAAAATGVVIATESASVGVVKKLDVDRPFTFFIRDHKTGSVLFLGRINDPTK